MEQSSDGSARLRLVGDRFNETKVVPSTCNVTYLGGKFTERVVLTLQIASTIH